MPYFKVSFISDLWTIQTKGFQKRYTAHSTWFDMIRHVSSHVDCQKLSILCELSNKNENQMSFQVFTSKMLRPNENLMRIELTFALIAIWLMSRAQICGADFWIQWLLKLFEISSQFKYLFALVEFNSIHQISTCSITMQFDCSHVISDYSQQCNAWNESEACTQIGSFTRWNEY